MKRKAIALLLTAAMTCGLLAGCSAKETDTANKDAAATTTEKKEEAAAEKKDEPAKEEAKEEVVLRFIDISTSPLRQEYFMGVFEQFEAEQGIKVEYEGVPWDDAADKLTVLGAANDLPDVLTISEKWMGQFISAEWIMPLDDLYAEMLEPVANVATKISVERDREMYGNVYRIPDGLINAGFFYRKDWVEEIGYEIPTGDDWTWDAYFDLVRALTDPEKNRYGLAYRGGRGCFDTILSMLISETGGQVYDEEGNWIVDSPECQALFDEYTGLYLEGHAPKDSLNWGFTELVDNFSGGLVGTLFNNPDVIPILQGTMEDDQWGVLPMPTAPDGKVYNSAGMTYPFAVSTDSEHPEEAKLLIEYLCKVEKNMKYGQNAGMIPIRNDSGDDPMYGPDGPYAGFLVQMDYPNLVFSTSYGAFDFTDLHQDMLHTEVQKYLLGQQSSVDVMTNIGTEMEKRMKAYLAENEGTSVEKAVSPADYGIE